MRESDNSSQVPSHSRHKLGRTRRPALVAGQDGGSFINLRKSAFQAARLLGIAEIVQQHSAGQEHGGGVDRVLSNEIGRGTVDGLEVGVVLAVAGTGREAKTADGAAGNVGEDIAVLVVEHHHVERLGNGNHAPRQVVDQEFLISEGGVRAYGLLHQGAEATIGTRLNRVLGSEGDAAWIALCLTLYSQLAGGGSDAVHLLVGGDAHCVGSHFLDGRWQPPRTAAAQRAQFRHVALAGRIHAFQIVAYDHVIDALGREHGTAIAGLPAHGTDIDICLLPPAQVPQNRTTGSATGTEERAVRVIDRRARLSRKCLAVALLRLAPVDRLNETQEWGQFAQDFHRRAHRLRGRVVAGNHADRRWRERRREMPTVHRSVPSWRMYSIMPPAATMRATKGSSGSASKVCPVVTLRITPVARSASTCCPSSLASTASSHTSTGRPILTALR